MGGHDQAIEQAQSRDLYAARFGDAVEDGRDFFSLHVAFAEAHPKPEVGDRIQVRNQFVDRCGRSGGHGFKELARMPWQKTETSGQLITGIK